MSTACRTLGMLAYAEPKNLSSTLAIALGLLPCPLMCDALVHPFLQPRIGAPCIGLLFNDAFPPLQAVPSVQTGESLRSISLDIKVKCTVCMAEIWDTSQNQSYLM